MLVSTKGRYALRVLVDLARREVGERTPLRVIAERQGISEKYLENILSPLVRDGVLTGVRGKGGGYRLSRDPREISVAEVLRSAEGSIAPIACLENNPRGCERAATCPTIAMWSQLDEMISTYLGGVAIADLASCPGGVEELP